MCVRVCVCVCVCVLLFHFNIHLFMTLWHNWYMNIDIGIRLRKNTIEGLLGMLAVCYQELRGLDCTDSSESIFLFL